MYDLERLEQAITFIEEHPEQHWQGTWISVREYDQDGEPVTPGTWCGTAACLFGWIVLLNGDLPVDPDDPETVARNATELAEFYGGETSYVHVNGQFLARSVPVRVQELVGLDEGESRWWSQAERTVPEMRAALERMRAGAFSPRAPHVVQ